MGPVSAAGWVRFYSVVADLMQFIDLAAQQAIIKDKIDRCIQAVLSHGKYIMGPEVKELEERLASFVGTKHAIGYDSSRDTLFLIATVRLVLNCVN